MLRIPFQKSRRMLSAVSRFDPPTSMSTVRGMHVRIPPPAPNTPAGREGLSSGEISKINREKVCMADPCLVGGYSKLKKSFSHHEHKMESNLYCSGSRRAGD